MNENELLEAIGEARDTYVAAAQNAREKKNVRRFPAKRLVLIAAIVSLMVFLLGCAVVLLHLRDFQIAETEGVRYLNESGERIEPTEVTKSVLAVRGIKDSPNYLATMEWYEFAQSYESILESGYEDNSLENYEVYEYIYGCYSQEMANKVDEIAEKYDLKLLSQQTVIQRWQTDILFDALGIDGVCHAENAARVSDGSGYFFAEGNFSYDFKFLLPQENGNWDHEVWATVCYSRDDYFHPIYTTMDADLYEEWYYTTSDGVEVLIAQSYSDAVLAAEVEDGFLWVMLNTSMMLNELETPIKQDIERMAEVIDFTIHPQIPDMTDIDAKLEAADKAHEEEQAAKAQQAAVTYASYGEYVQKYIDATREYAGTPYMRHYYALVDLNGDGVEELLMGESGDHFRDILTIKDGEVAVIRKWSTMNLCENNVIRVTHRDSIMVEESGYSFFTVTEDGSWNVLEEYRYSEPDEAWFQWMNPNADAIEESIWEEVSEENVKAAVESYAVIGLEMKPITEYPFE